MRFWRGWRGFRVSAPQIVGSAPNFPHGAVDDIQALAQIARRKNIGLHVDCCLGGFLVPFMEKAGFPMPPVDFRVPGVTSISCDTHKYGFAPKGSSVVMYHSKNLRRYQYFVTTDWPGGIYASPAIAGSRPGSLIAACWAAMVHMGEDGYIASTKQIVSTTRHIVQGCVRVALLVRPEGNEPDSLTIPRPNLIRLVHPRSVREIPDVFVYGNPEVSVVALGSKKFNILMLGAEMTKRGWNLSSLQFPPALHISVTYLTQKAVEDFINDVREIADRLRNDPNAKEEGMAAMYGLAAAIPDRSLIDEIARGFIDALYINNA